MYTNLEIFDLCLEVEWRKILRVLRRWWYQEGLYFAGLQEEGEGQEGWRDEGGHPNWKMTRGLAEVV